jgi:pseudouridine-5'-phosphate glycosidase
VILVAEPVRQALAERRPIVALESTLIAHGLPRPQNLETALAMEAMVREHGAQPATIGIIAGQPIVGLSSQQLELLATSPEVVKASRRDLPVLVAAGSHGGTTVAGTLALMELVGLRVLATGGIGGVHRGAEQSFDVSADLAELARTRALVVCSGAKAILDLPRTVELLETLGVTLLGLGTEELPAFFVRGSGLPVTAAVETPAAAAAVVRARWALGLAGGVILAVPAPADVALDPAQASTELESALTRADVAGVRGRELTPFLLNQLAELTAGRSLAANQALLLNNARVAALTAATLGSSDEGERSTR